MSYRLTHRAQRDVEAIGVFVAQDSRKAAAHLLRRLSERWNLLSHQPYSGAPRDDLLSGIRSVAVGEYLSFYRLDDRDVVILRVLHGRRAIGGEDFSD